MSNLGWSNDGGGTGGSYTHPSTHPATMITVADSGNNFVGTEVETVLAELFTSGNSGKNSLETAIVSKGSTVSKAGSIATFAELVSAINGLPTGGGYATGTTTSQAIYSQPYFKTNTGTDDTVVNASKIVVTGLGFKPDEIIYYRPNFDGSFYHWSIDRLSGSYTVVNTIDQINSSNTTIAYSLNRITLASSGANQGVAVIADGAFTMPTRLDSETYKWIAYKRP